MIQFSHFEPVREIAPESIRAQLDRILKSPRFASSDSLRRFLNFAVEQVLEGHAEWLKESVLGVEVFERGDQFDPRLDAIVRVEARRLRSRLIEYYQTHGKDDPIVIEVPKGSYVPVFRAAGDSASEPVSPVRISAILVLPFVNLSPAAEDEYFADGLTEEVITSLTRIRNLRVIARSTAFRYQGKGHDLPRIGSELKVDAVLEGSVRHCGSRMRVDARLIAVSSCFQIWSHSFDFESCEVSAIQQEISDAVGLFVSKRVPAAPRSTLTPEAYDLYLRGIFFENQRSREGFSRGLDYLRQAAALAPDSAQVMARLSSLYSIEGLYGYGAAHDVMPLARAAASQALAVDQTLAEAHSAAGLVSSLYDWDWSVAECHFKRALDLNSGQPEIHRCYAFFFLAPTGRASEAVETVRRAKILDPLSLILNASECLALLWAGRFEESIACGLRSLELGKEYYMTHSYMSQCYMAWGKPKEALEHARTAVCCSGGAPVACRDLGVALAGSGMRAEAMHVAENLTNRHPVPYSMIADIYVALADFDGAFHWFGEACRARCSMLILAMVRQANRVLWRDERFGHLLRELGLENFAISFRDSTRFNG